MNGYIVSIHGWLFGVFESVEDAQKFAEENDGQVRPVWPGMNATALMLARRERDVMEVLRFP